MTRIASGVTDQYIYFVAVDATDLKTRETGLATWSVYRSRNGAAAAAFTTPTINETSSANMPGVYELLLDEDMTIDAGDETQEMCFHITHSGMAPVTRVIELYRPKITAGETLTVGSGAVSTVTTLTNLPAITNNWLTAAGTAADFGTEVADAVWDEALSGHQATGTAGRYITLAGAIIEETTSTGTPTTTTLQLTAGSTTDDFYNDMEIIPTSGALVGQARVITDYTGATRTVIIDEAWTSAPASGISVLIRAQHNHSRTQLADTVLTRQMTESYASDGTAPTLAQAICLIQQTIGDFAISGTTLTVKKLDGSTTAATYTLDSSTAPTSRTRST
jgi:hypothetical protein